jgi:hypothetical protein
MGDGRTILTGLIVLLAACQPREAGRSAPADGMVAAGAGGRPTQTGTDPRPVAVRRIATARPRLMVDDEIDALAARLDPPARFAGHRPAWRVETRTFAFRHLDKAAPAGDGRIETKDHQVVFDGERVVALLRSGDILLIARTPDSAPTRLALPTERLHLDNLPGPSLPTHPHVQSVKTHGSIYAADGSELPPDRWESDGTWLAYVRERRSPELTVVCRYIFTVDPVYGYRIDAERSLDSAAPFTTTRPAKPPGAPTTEPGIQLGAGTFCPGCYVPWDYAAIYHRTAYTPSAGGIRGWANNLVTMDRCDDLDRRAFDWRDGGFIAYLPGPDGWSVCFTRRDGGGSTRKLSVCNAHNDFHITIWSPPVTTGADGRHRLTYVHRLLSLPPELSRQVWTEVDLIQREAKSIVIRLGRVEDFEAQPVPLTEPARGLVWTSGGPPLVAGAGRGGGTALLISGRQWPNLPQVSLIPGRRYRLQAWFKLLPWDAARVAAERERDAVARAKLAKEGKPLPAPVEWERLLPRAYVRGDFYEWSPYADPMVVEQTTAPVATADGAWHESVLVFTAPQWGPNINLSFHAEDGDALLDDFALTPIAPAREPGGPGEGAP